MNDSSRSLTIRIDDATSVSAIAQSPADAFAGYVFAHGAGAGMEHRFMADIASGLSERGIATLRFQFPYMERQSKRPDSPAAAHAAIRSAVATAAAEFDALPLFAGGKSFGGRMTSQAQAAAPLTGVRGLVFVGFPLHAADVPSISRAAHLSKVDIPMLFVQGTLDRLAQFELIGAEVAKLGNIATLMPIEHADHAFHVLRRSGRTDAEVLTQVLDGMAAWMRALVPVSAATRSSPTSANPSPAR